MNREDKLKALYGNLAVLTPWEGEFIGKLGNPKRKWDVSLKQWATVEKIYEERSGALSEKVGSPTNFDESPAIQGVPLGGSCEPEDRQTINKYLATLPKTVQHAMAEFVKLHRQLKELLAKKLAEEGQPADKEPNEDEVEEEV